MGHLVEKYTREYFTGLNPDGTEAGYGILGYFEGEQTVLREADVRVLSRINFKNAHVLEIGFGRGESIKYIWEQGAASYVGIDFSPAAFELAQQYLNANNLNQAKIVCADALEFIQNNPEQLANPIDIIVLLDVVEHIPRHELSLLFLSLQKYTSKKSICVINTPVYRYDNDVIAHGIDERNHIDAIDLSDFIEQTKGMHCNKYSISSLQEFMKHLGFYNLTEYQIYACGDGLAGKIDPERDYPYRQLWDTAHKNAYPIHSNYLPDILEYAYVNKSSAELITINEGPLEGCQFTGNPLAHEHQNEVLSYFKKYIPKGSIVFDVGAYIGLTSLYFAQLTGGTGTVISFEPNKYNLLRLKNNLSLNPTVSENILLYNLALSDSNGTERMLLSDEIDNGYASTSQLSKGGCTAMPKAELIELGFFEETVHVETLDAFVAKTTWVPDVIKIDVEGAEVRLLKGAMQTLSKYKPALLIELHNTFASCFVFKFLEQLGYQIHIGSEEWGNRTQIFATQQDPGTPNGLIEQEIEQLCKEYTSYRAKLYQENLEEYMKRKKVESAQLKENIASQHTHVAQLEQQIYSQQAHTEQLKEQLSCQKIHVEQLEQQICTQQTHTEQLEQQICTQQIHTEQLEQQLSSQQTHVEQLKQQLSTQQAHTEQLKEQLSNQQMQQEQLEKVSVIIPTYNRAQFIEASIRSVLNQSYTNLEVIVIDDGSTDTTQDIVTQIGDPRLLYIKQSNHGRSHARNQGLNTATGHYIAFLDSDDLYLPNKIALQVEYLKNHPYTGLVYTSAHLIDEHDKELPNRYQATRSGCIYEHIAFFTPETITLPTVMTYKAIIEDAGKFDENMYRFEDTDLWRRIAKNYRIDALETPTCLLRTHQGNSLHNQDPEHIVRALEYYATKILKEDANISEPIKRAGLWRLYVYYAKAFATLSRFSFLSIHSIKLMGIAATHRLGINPYRKKGFYSLGLRISQSTYRRLFKKIKIIRSE